MSKAGYITEVKDVNGELWDIRDARLGEGETVSLDKDWEENDPTSSEYIKNRTHYIDENGDVQKLDMMYIPTELTDEVDSLNTNKMNKANPTGTGNLSMGGDIYTNGEKVATEKYVDGAIAQVSVAKDWNQNDPTSGEYIKNRTHYVDNRFELSNLEWNGDWNSDDAPSKLETDNYYIYKMSNNNNSFSDYDEVIIRYGNVFNKNFAQTAEELGADTYNTESIELEDQEGNIIGYKKTRKAEIAPIAAIPGWIKVEDEWERTTFTQDEYDIGMGIIDTLDPSGQQAASNYISTQEVLLYEAVGSDATLTPYINQVGFAFLDIIGSSPEDTQERAYAEPSKLVGQINHIAACPKNSSGGVVLTYTLLEIDEDSTILYDGVSCNLTEGIYAVAPKTATLIDSMPLRAEDEFKQLDQRFIPDNPNYATKSQIQELDEGKQDNLVFEGEYDPETNKVVTKSVLENKLNKNQGIENIGKALIVDSTGEVIPGDLFSKEDTSNKVVSISAASTDTQYPSAKCVYDLIGDVSTAISSINAIIGGASE